MEKINYKKIIKELNKELDKKYDKIVDLVDFDYKENREYFYLGNDNHDRPVIFFQKMPIYLEMTHVMENHSEKDVTRITKDFFNEYLDNLIKLKF